MILRYLRNRINIYWFILSGCLYLSACNIDNKSVVERKENGMQNVVLDDSTIALYVPKSLFDSSLSENRSFGFYEHYYGNKERHKVNIQVRYELELEGGAPKGATHEVTTRLIVANSHISGLNGSKKVVSIDSIIRSDLRIGIINYSTGSGDTAFYTTLAFVPNHKRPWYEIYINYDKSKLGQQLKDSIPKILESISVNQK